MGEIEGFSLFICFCFWTIFWILSLEVRGERLGDLGKELSFFRVGDMIFLFVGDIIFWKLESSILSYRLSAFIYLFYLSR